MPGEVLSRDTEYTIGSIEQIPPGEGRTFEVAGLLIAVFRTRAGEVFATQALCPHRQGPLADGMLGGRVIVCPLHDRAYDLGTGEEIGTDCKLMTYPVRTSGDGTLHLTLPPG